MKKKIIGISIFFMLLIPGFTTLAAPLEWEIGILNGIKTTENSVVPSSTFITDKNDNTEIVIPPNGNIYLSIPPAFVDSFRVIADQKFILSISENNTNYKDISTDAKYINGGINTIVSAAFSDRDKIISIRIRNNSNIDLVIKEIEFYPLPPPQKGLLDGKTITYRSYYNKVEKMDYRSELTDKSTSSFVNPVSSDGYFLFYDFPKSVQLTSFSGIKNTTEKLYLKLYDEDLKLIETLYTSGTNIFTIPISNETPIKRIETNKIGAGGYILYEIEAYGTVLNEPEPEPEPTAPPEVIELIAKPKHNRVDLSWTLPGSENLKHVNIYRDEVPETAFIDVLFGTEKVYAASKKIFETNGTYFNDLTVKPETTYEYTLTTQSIEGLESEGVTEVVTTPEEPAPEIIGGEFEKNPETGDYTYTWEEPTTGKVNVLVGGNLYKTVNAADKKIVIPAKDMKFNVAGVPQVQLIPVSESGKEGTPITPPSNSGGDGGIIENVKVPFGANDLLGAGTGLLWVVGPFVLLALAFLVVPKLRNMLVQAITGKKNATESPVRRSNDSPGRESRERVKRAGRMNREPRETIYKGRLTRAERRG